MHGDGPQDYLFIATKRRYLRELQTNGKPYSGQGEWMNNLAASCSATGWERLSNEGHGLRCVVNGLRGLTALQAAEEIASVKGTA